jgi:hypothetical protein
MLSSSRILSARQYDWGEMHDWGMRQLKARGIGLAVGLMLVCALTLAPAAVAAPEGPQAPAAAAAGPFTWSGTANPSSPNWLTTTNWSANAPGDNSTGDFTFPVLNAGPVIA